MIIGLLPGKAPPEPVQSGGRYKFKSDGNEYTVELKETTTRLDSGKRKKTFDYWATCVKSNTKKVPGDPFKFDPEKWNHLIKVGYIVPC